MPEQAKVSISPFLPFPPHSLTFVRRNQEYASLRTRRIVVSPNNSDKCHFGTQLARLQPDCCNRRLRGAPMDIRLVSSLTPDDEARLAPSLMAALTNLLDQLPIRYTVRFETAAGKAFAHDHAPVEVPLGDASKDIPADALLSFTVPKA
jgi:hypothetical protein